jgi:hypothetical protein
VASVCPTALQRGCVMLEFELNKESGVLVLKPRGPLSADDFATVTETTDAYIEKTGHLNGVMIYAKSFPGWEDFGGLMSHLKFVRDHHKKIKKLATVSDSRVLTIMPKIAEHFISAEARHFDSADLYAAEVWLAE